MNPSIYLDNAATSFPKPAEVPQAVTHFLTEIGVSHNRSASHSGDVVKQKLAELRSDLSSLFSAPPSWFHFPFSATDGLNLTLSGFIQNLWRKKQLPNGQSVKDQIHVITTATEHNSVLRPLHYWQEAGWIRLTILPCNELGLVDPEELKKAVEDQTGMFVLSHASGVTGTVQDAKTFGAICQEKKIFFVLDASQTAGSIPLSIAELGCHATVFPGHKSLLGPMGTAVMAIDPNWEKFLDPIRLGGTGTQSHRPHMPTEPAEKWAAGHQNLPGLFGLAAGVEFLKSQDLSAIHQKSWRLTKELADGIRSSDGLRILGYWDSDENQPGRCVPILSVTHQWLQPAELANAILEAKNIVCRSGYHCAPLIHPFLSTSDGGTLRFSPGIFSSEPDIQAAVESLEMVTKF